MTRIRKKAELSSAAKNKKRCTPPHHQLSFPCTRESIYPHAPDATFENALTAIDNCIEQPNSNNGSKGVTPNHNTCCTMGPRVREDDELRDGSKKQTETATTEVKR
ncbi:TPA: hypothetical protein ACGU4V_002564 [Vibrio vulnificus]